MSDYIKSGMSGAYKKIFEEATSKAEEMGLDSETAHNGPWDAFRHAYASARLTQEYGVDLVRKAGIKHEKEGFANANPGEVEAVKSEIVMDLFNNQIGRKYAVENPNSSPEQLASVVLEKGIKGGELIQSLSDTRISTYKDHYLKQLDSSWFLSENKNQDLMLPKSESLACAQIDHNQNPLFAQSQAAATGLYAFKNLDYDKQGGNQVTWGVYAVAVENDFKKVSGMYEDKGVFHIVDNSNKMIPSRVSVETSAVFELTADQSRQKVEQIMVASLAPSGNGAVQGEKNSSPTQNPDIDPNAKGGRSLG